MTTSTAVPVTVSGTVTPPNVSLTSPVNNSTYTAPATIFIAASATSPAGTVTNVQFYNGNTLLGSDGTRPFEYSWTSVPAGTYSITAKATDNLGGVATTPAATVTVNSPISIPTITSIAPTSGPAGVGVAIKGTNFTNVSAIRFNGITATETYLASPTLLYATVPAGATTGRIQVVAQDGSASSAASFSVAAISSRWTSRTRAAVARIGHGTIATNGRIYVFGGMNSTGVLNSLEIYNPSTNTWSSGAPMPVATGGMSFVLGSNGYIYMFGGITSTHVSTTYRYTPSTNTWTALAGMPVALFEAAAAGTTNGKIYVFGGEPSTALGTSTSGTWIYDIATNTWSTGANMPLGVQQHSAITGADGRIYIIGGRSLSSKEPVGLVQIYNPTTNTWTSGAAMPLPKVQFGAVRAADNRIYIIGGKAKKDNSTGPYFHSVEIYNPSTNTWATGPVIRVPLGQQTAAKLSDNLYAISGSDDTVRNYNFQLILPPVAPATLTATAASSSQINLKWTDKALNETSQVVERATASSGPFAAIATLGVNAVSYSNTGLSGNVTYYYRIKATNSAGSSTYSNTAGATTPVAIVSARGSIGDQTRQVNNLSVSPNPANKQTRISFSLDRDQKVHLLMYNMEGKVIDHLYEGNAVAGKKYQFNWNVGSNASGIYITTLRTEKAVYHQKVMVLP
jgi:N-acetylneuraminic acid mutarotase